MTTTSKNTYLTLSDGNHIPLLGFGTFQKPPMSKEVIKTAIKIGYRHIDTAHGYENEEALGDALREIFAEGDLKRSDIFITTKIWGTFHRPDLVEHALRLSLKALQLDYVDLYLMHSPMAIEYKDDEVLRPNNKDGTFALDDIHYLDTWKAMESLVAAGLTKSIGVSNFNKRQLSDVLKITKVPCVNNQIENHPLLNQEELINFCKAHNVFVTSYSPIGAPNRDWATDQDPDLRRDPVVMEMAKTKGCTPVQILIAYNLCQGLICIPKSQSEERIKENFKSLDVKLTDKEIERLDSLACNFRAIGWKFLDKHIHYPFTEGALQ